MQPVFACAVCTGQLDDNASNAANMGIWVMLFVLFAVFAGIFSFILNLAKRSREVVGATESSES